MPTLQQGQSASIQLSEGETLTVTPVGQAQVSTRGVSGNPLSAPAMISGATTFGPYTESGAVSVAAIVGTADYAASGVVSGAGILASRLELATQKAAGNNPFDLGVMASPPTITSPGTLPSPARQIGYWSTNGASQFRPRGATNLTTFLEAYGGTTLRVRGCRTDATTYQNANCAACVDFITDSPAFQFEFFDGAANNVFMAVGRPDFTNMQLTSATGHTESAFNSGFGFDWGGVRKLRGYRIWMILGQGFGRINIGEDDTLYAPPAAGPRILDIGDSIEANTISPSVHGYFGFASVTREISGCDVVGHGIGASGYTIGNILGNAWRIADAAAGQFDLIRLHLGINDVGASQAVVRAAAVSALAALRAAVGATYLEVKGPFGGARNADAAVLGVEAGIQQAVADLADSRMIFTPTVTASPTNWPETLGVRDTDTAAGAAGNSRYITGNDNIHPSVAGAEYYARRRWATTLAAVRAAGW